MQVPEVLARSCERAHAQVALRPGVYHTYQSAGDSSWQSCFPPLPSFGTWARQVRGVCQAEDAAAVEGALYKQLEATLERGTEFAAAVRAVLRDETSWCPSPVSPRRRLTPPPTASGFRPLPSILTEKSILMNIAGAPVRSVPLRRTFRRVFLYSISPPYHACCTAAGGFQDAARCTTSMQSMVGRPGRVASGLTG